MAGICGAAHYGDTGLCCARLTGHPGAHACETAGENVMYWTSRLPAQARRRDPFLHGRSGARTAAPAGRPRRTSGR